METVPILLDTDIGSSIDDALCLAYLLAHPRCELLGITTVTGEPKERAMLADALCRAAGRKDMPIHCGSDRPILVEQRQQKAGQAKILSNWDHRADFVENTAIDFMREVILARPGEVTLLAIGPLTNVGLLFRLDPKVPRLLKSLVMMAGVFSFPNAHVRYPREWNVMLDPHAAAIVYGTLGLENLSVGLDVTTKCQLPVDLCQQRLAGGALDLVGDFIQMGLQRPVLTFHDPLAAAAIFAPELLEYSRGTIAIELKSDLLTGMTIWAPKASGQSRIAIEVDVEGFFEEYFTIIK